MNWSDYSRFVGDIFGAPLAMEGLLAFFLESTFLGLWIFGWDRLSKRVHLATIWLAAIGTVLSAYFILAANSWMQHPVGYRINAAAGRAELDRHLGRAHQHGRARHLPAHDPRRVHDRRRVRARRGDVAAPPPPRHRPRLPSARRRRSAPGSLVVVAASSSSSPATSRPRIMTEVQPMKMAAAEALWTTTRLGAASRSSRSARSTAPTRSSRSGPDLLSFLGHGQLRRHGRGHQRPPGRSTRRSTARATTRRTSRSPTGRSA